MHPLVDWQFTKVTNAEACYSMVIEIATHLLERDREQGMTKVLILCLTISAVTEISQRFAPGVACTAISGSPCPESFYSSDIGSVRVCVATSVMQVGISSPCIDGVILVRG